MTKDLGLEYTKNSQNSPVKKKNSIKGLSCGPVVKTLCLHCRSQIQSLVGELGSRMLCSAAKKIVLIQLKTGEET